MDRTTQDQRRAREALDAWVDSTSPTESAFFSLQGYAGVGKTYLVADWVRTLLERRPDMNITIVAPTNKAVDVLRGKCGQHMVNGEPLSTLVTFRTLDSFLGFRVKRNDDWQIEKSRAGKQSTSPDLVICDEASMVKLEYHNELTWRRVPVLYVGDPAQLQPVGEAMSPAFSVPEHVLMTEIVRQEEGNPIIEMATFLRKHIEAGTADFILQDLREFARPEDRRIAFTTRDKVHGWACAALDKGMDCRILAFTNATVNEANAQMHALRYPDAPLYGEGETVLVNEAFDYDDETLLTNGELLRVVECTPTDPIEGVEVYKVRAQRLANNLEVDGEARGRVLEFLVPRDPDHAFRVHRAMTDEIYALRKAGKFGDSEALMRARRPLNKLAPLRHAYACTVHKSQGSTYDVAFVDFSDVYRSREMRARLMYVAATRPAQFLVMVHGG